jgi:hypothetical protein
MKRSPSNGTWLGRLSIAVVGLTWLAAGCGEQPDTVEIKQGEVITWTNLTLMNNWQNYWGTSNPPAVALINGIVTFRGALKNPNPQGNIAFVLPPAMAPQYANNMVMEATLSNNVGGALLAVYKDPPPGVAAGSVYVFQDGIYPNLGNEAKTFTSLDGVSYDKDGGTVIGPPGTDWVSMYGYRQNMPNSGCTTNDCGVYVRLTSDGFIRFKGALTNLQGSGNSDFFLGTLPSSQYIPGQNVTIPVSVGGLDPAQSWSALTIYSTGDVFVNGNYPSASAMTSFEGASFSKTNSGNVNIPLSNGWHAFSARTVKIGKYGDVVRLQGGISGGTSATICSATNPLPATYRPPKTVRIVSAANGPVPATIVISPSGVMTFEGPPVNVAAVFLSLDGVSYAW